MAILLCKHKRQAWTCGQCIDENVQKADEAVARIIKRGLRARSHSKKEGRP